MKTRDEIVDRVGEIDAWLRTVVNPTPDQFDELNAELDHLRNQAGSLGMPVNRIQQLKLQVTAGIREGNGSHRPAKATNPNQGQRTTFPLDLPPSRPRHDAQTERATPDKPGGELSHDERKQRIADLFGKR